MNTEYTTIKEHRSGTKMLLEVVLHNKSGSVLVSDCSFMGFLAAAGYDPVSDNPRPMIEGRLWWAFPPEHEIKIRGLAASFYGLFTGNMGPSFVRKAMEVKKGYALMAKVAKGKQTLRDPLSIRGLVGR